MPQTPWDAHLKGGFAIIFMAMKKLAHTFVNLQMT